MQMFLKMSGSPLSHFPIMLLSWLAQATSAHTGDSNDRPSQMDGCKLRSEAVGAYLSVLERGVQLQMTAFFLCPPMRASLECLPR